jgi:hypothetical protein
MCATCSWPKRPYWARLQPTSQDADHPFCKPLVGGSNPSVGFFVFEIRSGLTPSLGCEHPMTENGTARGLDNCLRCNELLTFVGVEDFRFGGCGSGDYTAASSDIRGSRMSRWP